MKVLVSGASGLVGTALRKRLTEKYHTLVRLVRPDSKNRSSTDIPWDPRHPLTPTSALEGFDAVVHLAGESIAAGRWTEKRKEEIHNSRVAGTKNLCEALADLKQKPGIFISASAIGYYGDRGSEKLNEMSSAGSGFLPEVCLAWEKATDPLIAKGIPVTILRFGIILSPAGGALKKMLLPFKIGAGGNLGAGFQFMSWVDLEDVVGVIEFVLNRASLMGPVNVTAPYPVTNTEFTKTLGRVLSRPTVFPLPAFAARLAFGEMADALLLSSAKVMPEKLVNTGYAFKYPTLEGSLRHLLQ